MMSRRAGKIAFADDPAAPGVGGPTYVATIPAVTGKGQLLDRLAKQLKIPAPFGRNWDALEEMLRRLDWLPERSIVLAHEAVPTLASNDLRTYLSILREANAFWEGLGDRYVIAVFSATAREELVTEE